MRKNTELLIVPVGKYFFMWLNHIESVLTVKMTFLVCFKFNCPEKELFFSRLINSIRGHI